MGKIMLLDGHSLIHRAFYGMPDFTNAEGTHTGAVYGFLSILFMLLSQEQPDGLVVIEQVHPRARKIAEALDQFLQRNCIVVFRRREAFVVVVYFDQLGEAVLLRLDDAVLEFLEEQRWLT